jgi:hypothetical protein
MQKRLVMIKDDAKHKFAQDNIRDCLFWCFPHALAGPDAGHHIVSREHYRAQETFAHFLLFSILV